MMLCAAGRQITHESESAWNSPCGNFAQHVLVVDDGNGTEMYYLCPFHLSSYDKIMEGMK